MMTKADMLNALLQVQKALACHRDGEDYIHPQYGPLCLEELKYKVVDPVCGNDEDNEGDNIVNLESGGSLELDRSDGTIRYYDYHGNCEDNYKPGEELWSRYIELFETSEGDQETWREFSKGTP